MHFSHFLSAVLGISGVTALQSPHDRAAHLRTKRIPLPREALKRASSNHGEKTFLNSKTEQFAVDGTGIPDVNFDIGESYAGTLPITNNATDENQLFFWFFPSDNPAAGNEITIWLNGGPGCSSMLGLLQENGPFLWQPGTYRPIANPYSWVNLTNMVWVDQPVGTGFSPHAKGAPRQIKNENDVSKDFMGFWENFIDTFDLNGADVYLTGESYAGMYVPYIAYNMLEADNTEYFNVKGIQINDPSINYDDVMIEAPAIWQLNEQSVIFGLNETTMNWLNKRNIECGYDEFMRNSLVYPPTGPLPSAPSSARRDCNLWEFSVSAAIYINPCFNIYHVLDFCPYTWDVFGFPSLGWGPRDYFNRSDVQAAIHAPPTNYFPCGDDHLGLLRPGDTSLPSGLGPLPKVIEMTNNVVIGGGWLDYLLLTNGTLVTIQNMTWNGKQGFQEPPTSLFYVPYHPGLAEVVHDIFYQPIPGPIVTNVAGSGYLGTTHHERGLTFCSVDHAGHEIPEYAPGAAFRQLEFLLGRISSLSEISDFTTQHGNYTGHSDKPY